MIRITDERTNNYSSKFIETNKNFYILGIEYDKNNFEYTPLKIFNDGLNTDTLILNQILYPYSINKWFHNIKNNNILIDSNNNNIIYNSPFGYKNQNLSNKLCDLNINKIKTNDKIDRYNPFQSYNNNNIVNFLGQNENYIYVSNISVSNKSSSYYEPNHNNFNTSFPNYRGGIITNIIAINKNDLNNYNIIYTINRCYGNVKIITETNKEIYFVCGCYDEEKNQFKIIKLTKENNLCTVINQGYKDFDNNRLFDVVTPSDVIKIDDNNYKFYLNLMERSYIDKINDNTNVKHYNYIYECIFNIKTHLLNKSKISTENIDDLPEFGTYAGTYYNEIYHFENNSNNYLVTSKNSFVDNNDDIDTFKNDKLISYYKINDTITNDNINYNENIELNLTKKDNEIYETNLIKKNENIYINVEKFPVNVKEQVSPIMTSNNTPDGYEVIVNNYYSSYQGWYAFDNTANFWETKSSNTVGSWIELNFPEEVNVNKVSIMNYSNFGVKEANINEVYIDNIINDNNEHEYELSKTITSNKIRLTATKVYTNNDLCIRNIKYFYEKKVKALIKSNNIVYTINNSKLVKVTGEINLDKITELGIEIDKIDFNIIPNDFTLLLNNEWGEPLIVSYTKIKKMTLLKTIYKSDIKGNYYGMLFNKKNKTFLGISEFSSYIFDVNSENFDITDLNVKAEEIGIDLEGNNYVANQSTEVFIYGNEKANNIIVTKSDIPEDITYPYTTSIKVSSYNYKGERIKSKIKHTIIGSKSVKFKENNGRVLIKDTSINDDVEIEFIVAEDSNFDINSELEL